MEKGFHSPRTNYVMATEFVSSTPTSCPPPGLNKVVIYLKLSFYEQALLWNTEKIKVKRTIYECVSIKSLIVSNFDIFLLINIDY